ncbi:NlpC/P60 family protein [Tsukamurella sp. USMM236]|uniref:NlpC/P60 family protein n=1 Tax=Tsukamurella sp. USMM236 TaxID=3081301 RepID=UPI003016AE0B
MVNQHRWASGMQRTAAVTIVAAIVVGGADPAWARHVGDDPRAGHSVAVVPSLIVRLADFDQQIAALQNDVDIRRQSVNKTVIDVALAADAARAATNAVVVADREAVASDRAVDAAQRRLDEMLRAAYMQGNTSGGVADALTAPDGQTAVDRAAVLRRVAAAQAGTVTGLNDAQRRARSTRDAARIAKISADAAAGAAADRRTRAQGAVAQTLQALRSATDQRRRLDVRRQTAARALAEAKAKSGDTAGQQRIYDQYIVSEQQTVTVPSSQPAPAQAAPPNAGAPTAATSAAPAVSAPGGPPSAATAASSLLGQLSSLFGFAPQAQTASQVPAQAAAQEPAVQAPATPVSVASMSGKQMIDTVIARGLSVVGTRYSWGGGDINGPTVGVRDGGVADTFRDFENPGFDCSGLTLFAFAAVGIKLPHYSGYQYNIGQKVPLAEIKRGDLIFFGPDASQHEALYLGDNQMLEAPESGSTVKVSPLRTDGAMPYVVRLINS